jgi:aminoglycoside phosphotransferase (APT) family kinase protein
VAVKPPVEIHVDASTVRALLREQHPDLAELPLAPAGEGWDNALFRLGAEWVVRIPRRALAATLTVREHRWLPELAPALPLPIPVPERRGRPAHGVPWPWSIVRWFAGETALTAPLADPAAGARALGLFLAALHRPAPADAPPNPWRGVPLAARRDTVERHVACAAGLADGAKLQALFDECAAVPARGGPPLWIHGDLHPGNLIVEGGRLAAVIDFGDLTAGDPATDLAIGWMLFPAGVRASLFAAAAPGGVDQATVTRARGWALVLGLVFLASTATDPVLGALGRRTVERAAREPT